MTYPLIRQRLLMTVLAALLGLGLPACGSESSSPGPQAEKKPGMVTSQEQAGPATGSEALPTVADPAKVIVEKNIAVRPQQAAVTEDPEEIVVPPAEAGGRGLTRREREQMIKAQAAGSKNLENEVASISVDPKTGKGLTWKELEALQRQQEQTLDNEIASITVDDNGMGLTWKEFEAYLKNQPQFHPDMESGLSDSPNGNPLTYRELERLAEKGGSQEKEVR